MTLKPEKPPRRFWNWLPPENTNDSDNSDLALEGNASSRVLRIQGPIAEESWLNDEATPALFKSELEAGSGDVTVWINSPGGDCVAAAQIYNMLTAYPGNVTVQVDGIAASAASVIAMAGGQVAMSPVSMLMIHNPATLAMGDAAEMSRARDMLEAVKESIINAYETKTGLARAKLARLMDAETWMDANKAVELGFADTITGIQNKTPAANNSVLFSRRIVEQKLINQLTQPTIQPAVEKSRGRRLADLYSNLYSLRKDH